MIINFVINYVGQSNKSKCIFSADKIHVRFFSAEYVLTMLCDFSQMFVNSLCFGDVSLNSRLTNPNNIEQNKRFAEHLFFNRLSNEQEWLYIFENNQWLKLFQLLN